MQQNVLKSQITITTKYKNNFQMMIVGVNFLNEILNSENTSFRLYQKNMQFEVVTSRHCQITKKNSDNKLLLINSIKCYYRILKKTLPDLAPLTIVP